MLYESQNLVIYQIILELYLYITCFFCAILIIIMAKHIAQLLKSQKSYYSIIFLMVSAKLTIFLIYGTKIAINFDNIVSNTASDSLMFSPLVYSNLIYLSNFGYMILLTIICKRYLILRCNTIVNKITQKLSQFISISQIIIIIGNIVIIILYNFYGNKQFKITQILSCIINFFSSFCIFMTQFYMNIKFTGTLIESQFETLLKHLKKLQFSFFISRVVSGILFLFQGTGIFPYQFVINPLKNQPYQVLLTCFLYIGVSFVSDWLPLIISLNTTTIKILSNQYTKNLKASLLLQSDQNYLRIIQGSDMQQNSRQIGLKQFTQQQIIDNDKTNLGILKKVKFNSKIYALRQIDIELSKYLIQQIVKQIYDKKIKKIKVLVNIKYSIIQYNKIYLITDYIKINLTKFLDNNRSMSLNQKIKIALKISIAIQQLHKTNLPHGSLKFSNILLEKDQIKISDHGLLSLKKFINLTKGYSNKSFYTAPQFLTQKNSIVNKPTKQGDIYSFGMILYQLFTNILDYRSLSLRQIYKSFKEEQTRPKIPQNIPSYLANIIRSCWQQQPSQRPTIQQIKTMLRQYSKK